MLNRQSLSQFNKTYQNDALTMNVLGASPIEIIVLLYEGAQSALRKAKIEMVQRNFAEKGVLIRKASDIIDGLNAALRVEVGSDIALQLRDLYLYMKYRLSMANLNNDAEIVEEVVQLLETLNDAWQQLANQQRVQNAPADARVEG